MEHGLIGTVAASAGGIGGAVVKRYLPGLVPGEAADTAAVVLSDVVITGLALWTGSPGWMAFAYGMNGYMAGTTFEQVLPAA
jgi:hypothetical protein